MTQRQIRSHLHAFSLLLRHTVSAWLDDNAPRMGAALAFYTIFSMAPSLIIAIGAVGLIFGQSYADAQLMLQMNRLIGPDSAQSIMALVAATRGNTPTLGMALLEMIMLVVASTSALMELKSGLNTVWHVRPAENLEAFMRRRFMSLAFVGGLTFMLVTAFGVNVLLANVGIKASVHTLFQRSVVQVFLFGVMVLFFATVYKMLPDIAIQWKELWEGSALAAFLFTISKALISFYIGKTGITSAYGTAGSFVAVLLWVYCSGLIVYFGAEFIKIRSGRKSNGVRAS